MFKNRCHNAGWSNKYFPFSKRNQTLKSLNDLKQFGRKCVYGDLCPQAALHSFLGYENHLLTCCLNTWSEEVSVAWERSAQTTERSPVLRCQRQPGSAPLHLQYWCCKSRLRDSDWSIREKQHKQDWSLLKTKKLSLIGWRWRSSIDGFSKFCSSLQQTKTKQTCRLKVVLHPRHWALSTQCQLRFIQKHSACGHSPLSCPLNYREYPLEGAHSLVFFLSLSLSFSNSSLFGFLPSSFSISVSEPLRQTSPLNETNQSRGMYYSPMVK